MIYEIYTENGTKKKRALTGNGYGLPLGTWISYEGTCPDGFIESEQTFNTTTYASLYAMLGTNKVPARFDHSRLGDYEAITISSDANNPTVMSYDGFLTLAGNSGGSGGFLSLWINGESIKWGGENTTNVSRSSVTVPFKKGDSLYFSTTQPNYELESIVAYYKQHLAIKATPAYVEPDTVSDMVNTLRTQDSYSTSEVNTGKKWIDGKPIYRKVFYSDSWVDGSTFDASALNIDEVTSLRAMWLRQGYWYEAPYIGRDGFFCTLYYNTSTGLIESDGSISHAGAKNRTIIEYTKTTD